MLFDDSPWEGEERRWVPPPHHEPIRENSEGPRGNARNHFRQDPSPTRRKMHHSCESWGISVVGLGVYTHTHV